jgi:ABC-type glutathione transport system ATPase component
MTIVKYDQYEYNFEADTQQISAVIGSKKLQTVFLDVVKNHENYFSSQSIGALSSESSEITSLTLGDLISRQFKYHKKVSRRRSMLAVAEILQFLGSDNIVDVKIGKLDELQLANARLARAIALRPDIVLSWNYLSTMSAPVRALIASNIRNIHKEFQVGFLLFEQRRDVVKNVADVQFDFHPARIQLERTIVHVEPPSLPSIKSSPDEISGLDFVSS